MPADLTPRLAFAVQKLQEIVSVAATVSSLSGGGNVKMAPEPLDLATYTGAPLIVPGVAELEASMFQREEPYEVRRCHQPTFHAFPTTTIGSFPQTAAIRRARLQFKKGILSAAEYRERMAAEIGYAVGVQDALGLDVLVHGERK